jgi:hypothetical protein
MSHQADGLPRSRTVRSVSGSRRSWREIRGGRNKLNDVGSDRCSRDGKQNEIHAVFLHDHICQRLGPALLHLSMRIKPARCRGKLRRNDRQDAQQRESFALSHHVGLGHDKVGILKPDLGAAVDLQGRCIWRTYDRSEGQGGNCSASPAQHKPEERERSKNVLHAVSNLTLRVWNGALGQLHNQEILSPHRRCCNPPSRTGGRRRAPLAKLGTEPDRTNGETEPSPRRSRNHQQKGTARIQPLT